MRFYLGTHHPDFLWNPRFAGVPLFVSARALRAVKNPKRAVTRWSLDSGGFTELTMFGGWVTPAERYAAEVRAWRERVGGLDWAAPQDWMCEEFVCASTLLAESLVRPDRNKFGQLVERLRPDKRTAAKVWECRVLASMPLEADVWAARVHEHQRRTVENFLVLRELAPDVPFVPVVQGYHPADYLRHVNDYAAAGIDLRAFPTVGVGSVCRRQAGAEAAGIVKSLSRLGIRPHGFGFKVEGLRLAASELESADSLAWSLAGRRSPLPECRHGKDGKGSCANCPSYALKWYRGVVAAAESAGQDAFSPLTGEWI